MSSTSGSGAPRISSEWLAARCPGCGPPDTYNPSSASECLFKISSISCIGSTEGEACSCPCPSYVCSLRALGRSGLTILPPPQPDLTLHPPPEPATACSPETSHHRRHWRQDREGGTQQQPGYTVPTSPTGPSSAASYIGDISALCKEGGKSLQSKSKETASISGNHGRDRQLLLLLQNKIPPDLAPQHFLGPRYGNGS